MTGYHIIGVSYCPVCDIAYEIADDRDRCNNCNGRLIRLKECFKNVHVVPPDDNVSWQLANDVDIEYITQGVNNVKTNVKIRNELYVADSIFKRVCKDRDAAIAELEAAKSEKLRLQNDIEFSKNPYIAELKKAVADEAACCRSSQDAAREKDARIAELEKFIDTPQVGDVQALKFATERDEYKASLVKAAKTWKRIKKHHYWTDDAHTNEMAINGPVEFGVREGWKNIKDMNDALLAGMDDED